MKNIFPTPKSVTSTGAEVLVARIARAYFHIDVTASGELVDSAVEYLTDAFTSLAALLPPFEGDYTISLAEDPSDKRIASHGSEAYAISVTESRAILVGASGRALYYAALTLIALAERRGEKIYLPITEIVDYPDYSIRGIFAENRYNDFMTLDDWKCAVDTTANLKMNTLKVGLYGTWSIQYDKRLTQHAYIPFKSHPEIRAPKNRKYYSTSSEGWVHIPDSMPTIYEQDFFGDIVSYGKRRGVEVIPLINSLGHNSLIPGVIPEISARDEQGNPTGFGLCLADERTYETYFELYDEIIDRYLKPNGVTSFAIGLDEVGDSRGIDKNDPKKLFSAHCKCERCRDRSHADRMVEYMVRLVRHLKERGMKNVYVYYDMFFYSYDMMNEKLEEILRREDIYDVTVMDWWNYGASVDFFRGKSDKVNGLFRSIVKPMSGYFGWVGLSDNHLNIAECSAIAKKHNFEGVISYANFDPRFELNHVFLAETSWNAVNDVEAECEVINRRFFENKYPDNPDEAYNAWCRIQHFLNPYNYELKPPSNGFFNQYNYSYFIVDGDYPREHIGAILGKIDENPDYYLGYIKEFDERAGFALNFFKSDAAEPSEFNTRLIADIRAMTVNHTEIASLYGLYRSSEEGSLTNDKMISELSRLIRRRKSAMLDLEHMFMHSLVNQPMRIATICLEYLEELLSNVKAADAKGEQYRYDPKCAIDRTAPVFEFLR